LKKQLNLLYKFFSPILAGVFALLLSVPAQALEPVNPNATPETRALLNYLDSIYGKKIISGYNVYAHTPDDYGQTGIHAAIWGRDLTWMDAAKTVPHAMQHGYIPTIHWHWKYAGESYRPSERTTPVDMDNIHVPGTNAYNLAIADMDEIAAKLQVYADSGIPVLFRPLHEMGGGWFWWTDKENPDNSVKLWRMLYDYFTNTKGLNNLIWVYSAGEGVSKTVEFRESFWPGDEYVDISGVDIYHVDTDTSTGAYQRYWDTLSIAYPGKMLAMGEGDAIPHPDSMEAGSMPTWLWCMPWWGTPNGGRPLDKAIRNMRHDYVISLDEFPLFATPYRNVIPQVGILSPLDDGSGEYPENAPYFEAFAVDRDGSVEKVEYMVNDSVIGTVTSAPYNFTWNDAVSGSYNLTMRAIDDDGDTAVSNSVRINVGVVDIARGKTVTASSGDDANELVDGDLISGWNPDKSDTAWAYIDLEDIQTFEDVNLFFGWKIYPKALTIDVADANPEQESSWTTVFTLDESNESEFLPEWITYKQQFRIHLDSPASGRYVRLYATARAHNQTWGSYNINGIQIPVPIDNWEPITNVAQIQQPELNLNQEWQPQMHQMGILLNLQGKRTGRVIYDESGWQVLGRGVNPGVYILQSAGKMKLHVVD